MSCTLSGVIHEGDFTSKKYYMNAVFHYTVHIPDCCVGKTDCGLIVTHDNLNREEAAAAEFLQKTGDAPPCITVGIVSGNLYPTIPEGQVRNLRMNTYDMSTGKYADFVVDELIPYLIDTYDLSISPSPDLHMASGGSSGGISAWNLAWYRNDYFHRVYASSPTFSALGNGENDPFLLRKFEPKPIRVFTDYSENEPDDYFGSSWIAAENFIRALRFAKYDFKSEYHHGEGHCSRRNVYEYAVYRQLYLWKDWQTTPITIPDSSSRFQEIASCDSAWEKSTGTFSSHLCVKSKWGEYRAEQGKIMFYRPEQDPIVLTDAFTDITAIVLSVDQWRLYIADKHRRCVYAATVAQDGTFDGIYVHASLHVATECNASGVYSMCIDNDDRLYAVTELGIQCIRAYGLIDAILHSPIQGSAATQLALKDDGKLYALCGDTVYSRLLNHKKPADECTIGVPKTNSYYN